MKNQFNRIFSIVFLLIGLFLSGCTEEVQRGLRSVPSAFGNLNQIVVVMDDDLWEGPLGDTIRYYYSAAYPLLPQPEPIFDLRHFTPREMDSSPLLRELRTYMAVGLISDETSPTAKMIAKDLGVEKTRQAKEDPSFNSTIGHDKWAKGQLLIYQFAPTFDELVKVVKENFPAVKKRVNEFDRSKLEAYAYLNGENRRLSEEVRNTLGVELKVPSGFFMAINDGEVIWMRRETEKISSNIMLRKMRYTDQSQLTKENLIAVRDSIGRQYVSSTLPNTYMKINYKDLPVISAPTKVNGYYAVDGRGIWEIENDYMGGAFISYLILSPNSSEILFLDGFLHAPGENKRDFMQQLDLVMHTVKF
jgi:hypothetical protein